VNLFDESSPKLLQSHHRSSWPNLEQRLCERHVAARMLAVRDQAFRHGGDAHTLRK